MNITNLMSYHGRCLTGFLVILLCTLAFADPAHFVPISSSGTTWNVYILSAEVQGESIVSGDEIGVFYDVLGNGDWDDFVCVGAGVSAGSMINIVTYEDSNYGDGITDGFQSGTTVYFFIWDQSENSEWNAEDNDETQPSFGIGSNIFHLYANPHLMPSVSNLDFGEINVGSTSEQILTLFNHGALSGWEPYGALMIDSVTFSLSDYAISPNQIVIDNFGGTVIFTVTFSPVLEGDRSTTMIFHSNLPDLVVNITGSATIPPEPYLFVQPDTINFGFVLIGESAQSQMSIFNTGDAELTVTDISSNLPEFTTGFSGGFSLSGGDSSVIMITFSPLNSYEYDGILAVQSDGGDAEIILSGAGNNLPYFTSNADTSIFEDELFAYSMTAEDLDGDLLTFSAITLPEWIFFDGSSILSGTPTNDEVGDFNVEVAVADGKSDPVLQMFTLHVANVNDPPVANAGDDINTVATFEMNFTATVSLSGSNSSDVDSEILSYLWLEDGAEIGNVINPIVEFSEGAHEVILLVTDDSDAFDTDTIFVSVSCPHLGIAPSSIDFGEVQIGETHESSFIISNSGTAILNGEVAIGDSGFSVDSDIFSILPSGEQEITVSFQPNDMADFSGKIMVTSDGGIDSVSVSGVGVNGVLTVQSALDFGEVDMFSSSVLDLNISNSGNWNLTIIDVQITNAPTADFALFSYFTGVMLPGSENIISIKFLPGELGARTAYLTIFTDGTNPEIVVDLVGIGTGLDFSIDLSQNWQWLSFPVFPVSAEVSDLFDGISLLLLISRDGSFYIPESVDEIGSIECLSGYGVAMDTTESLSFQGIPCEISAIDIVAGWNFIGYPCGNAEDVESFFSPIINNLAIVKTDAGRYFVPEYGLNTIGNLVQWEGYKVGAYQSGTIDFDCSVVGKISDVSSPKTRYFKNIQTAEDFHLLIVEDLERGFEIGAFVDNLCIGAGISDENHAAVTIWKDNPLTSQIDGWNGLSEISLKILDGEGNLVNSIGDIHLNQSDFFSTITLEIPQKFYLHQNYPNPFNPTTTIRFDVPLESNIQIDIYDLLGRNIKSLVSGKYSAGNYSVSWNGFSEFGKIVHSGIYFAVMQAGEIRQIRKIVIIR